MTAQIYPPSTQLNNAAELLPVGSAVSGNIFTMTGSTTIANTVTETTLFAGGVGSLTLPINLFSVGTTIVVRIFGYLASAAAPTLRIRSKLGATVVSDTVAAAIVSGAAQSFTVDVVMTCRSSGGAGTVYGQAQFLIGGAGASTIFARGSNTTGTVAVDTTASQVLDVMLTWGTANVANTVTVTNATVEKIN